MPNAFESGERKLIPAVLIYARSAGKILMVHRNAADRPTDYHAGKWNGLGGKLEPDESPSEAAAREFREECGLDLPPTEFEQLGWLLWPNFKAHKNEDWLGFVFVVDLPKEFAEQRLEGPEGELRWVPEGDLEKLNLWAGDRHFIGHVQRREPFTGTIWYRGEQVLRAEVKGRS